MTPLSYDVETDGLSYHRGHSMFAYSTLEWDGVDPQVRRLDWRGARGKDARRRLETIWSPSGAGRWSKVCQNARFDVGFTQSLLGRDLRDDGHEVHETMALSHIFRNDRPSHALGNVAFDLFGYPRDNDEVVKPYLRAGRGYMDCPEWKLTPYQHDDAERTMLVFQYLYPKLAENGWSEIYEMERGLVWTTMGIEDRGIMLSVPRCREMQGWLRRESDSALAEYRALSGDQGTPLGSGLPKVLTRMGFSWGKRTKTGVPCTDKFVMEDLRTATSHPVFAAILKYRSYSRGVSIIEGYVDLADADGVIHPSIHPYGARSSRESIKNPSMQNVSKETTLLTSFPIPARKCFRPRAGYVNFHLDYRGIQARFLVHFSQDPEAIEIFRVGGDFHAEGGRCWYGERFAQVTGQEWKSLRDAAKNANFAKGFGAGVPKLAVVLKTSITDAAAGDRRFSARFPAYATMPRRFANQVRKHGYVETMFGRRLYLPRNKPYAGTNYVIQGSEAGVLKRAQIRVDDYLRRATGGEAGIILPIHDEIVIEWPRVMLGEAKACLRDIVALMVDFPQCNVPLEVEVKISTRDWATLREFPLEG